MPRRPGPGILGGMPLRPPTRLILVLVVGGAMTILSGTGLSARAAPADAGGDRPPAEGLWQPPLAAPITVTRAFEPPPAPYGRGHRGVDLAGDAGQPVVSAGAGTVGYAGLLAGRGVVTVLHAGGLRTTYEPVTATVRAGDAVDGGRPLGMLQTGHPGCPASACLHWGLLSGDTYLNPLSLLSPGPVRLLPLGHGARGSRAPPGPASAGSEPVRSEPVVPAGIGAGVGLAAAAGIVVAGGVVAGFRTGARAASTTVMPGDAPAGTPP